jgi:hypothetical protein
MSWEIRVPVRDPSAPLTEAGFDSRHLEDAEDAAVTRELVFEAMVNTDAQTVGDLVDLVEQAGPAERRELLNRCRVAAGLQTVEDVEAHEKFLAANRALRPRPPLRCAVCGVHPTGPGGMPDPNIAAVQRWHCPAHISQAEPGDMDPPPSRIGLDMRYIDPAEAEAERRRDEQRAEQDRQRGEDRAAEAEAIRVARERYERETEDNDYLNTPIAGMTNVRMRWR